MARTISIYSDGGLIGKNPSSTGGTWYYCIVENEQIIDECGGVLRPSDIDLKTKPPVTNNHTELYALTSAIQAAWPGSGRENLTTNIDDLEPSVHLLIHTDSNISLQRVRNHLAAMENVPDWMIKKVELAQRHLKRFLSHKFILLQGHPTEEDLKRGIGSKRNLPVSEWNVYCDKSCGRIGREYLEAGDE